MGFGNDDRKSFRANVVDTVAGVLFVGDGQISVNVVDQSATGFKLSTEDQRQIPQQIDALLDLDDGVVHSVQIRHVTQDGNRQTLGVLLYETRLRPPSELDDAAKRRFPVAKVLVVSAVVFVSALVLQASSIGGRLAAFSRHSWARQETATKPRAPRPANPPVPVLDRDRPFHFQRYLEDDSADWLQLAAGQRRLIRSLLDLCGGTRHNRLTSAQRAYVEFAAQASMLKTLRGEQRDTLQKELGRPFSGSALLQSVLERYSPHASPEELAEQFGALLVVSPTFAAQCGISDEVVAAVRKQLDDALQPLVASAEGAQDDVDSNQVVAAVSLRLQQLEESCRGLTINRTAPAKNPTQP